MANRYVKVYFSPDEKSMVERLETWDAEHPYAKVTDKFFTETHKCCPEHRFVGVVMFTGHAAPPIEVQGLPAMSACDRRCHERDGRWCDACWKEILRGGWWQEEHDDLRNEIYELGEQLDG